MFLNHSREHDLPWRYIQREGSTSFKSGEHQKISVHCPTTLSSTSSLVVLCWLVSPIIILSLVYFKLTYLQFQGALYLCFQVSLNTLIYKSRENFNFYGEFDCSFDIVLCWRLCWRVDGAWRRVCGAWQLDAVGPFVACVQAVARLFWSGNEVFVRRIHKLYLSWWGLSFFLLPAADGRRRGEFWVSIGALVQSHWLCRILSFEYDNSIKKHSLYS